MTRRRYPRPLTPTEEVRLRRARARGEIGPDTPTEDVFRIATTAGRPGRPRVLPPMTGAAQKRLRRLARRLGITPQQALAQQKGTPCEAPPVTQPGSLSPGPS